MIRDGKLLSSTGEKAAVVDLTAAIGRLLASFGVRGDAVAHTATYQAALSDLDVDDVIKALDRFSRHVVPAHDYRFAPSPVQVRAEVDRVEQMFRMPGRPAPRPSLAAPKPQAKTDEQKARIDALVEGFKRGTAMNRAGERGNG